MKSTERWFATAGMTAILLGALAGCQSASVSKDEGAPAEEAKAQAEAAKPRTVTLAEGTALKVRTTTALSTSNHSTGNSFSATLEEPLTEGGQVIAGKGSLVQGTIVEADKGGRVQGRARLVVRLTQLTTASGKTVDINTNVVAREARSTKKKDATKIGIGAGVGAAIGAIAGGGKGAAIGAAAGGGAGTGAVLATRGDAAVIPSETVLTFKLTAPASVTP